MNARQFIEATQKMGINLGPATFQNNKDTLLIASPIFIATFELDNIKNEIDKEDEPLNKINNHLNNIVSTLLLYLENRLKFMKVKNKLQGDKNSIKGLIKIYNKEGIFQQKFITEGELTFLYNIDKVRGQRHHTISRYNQNIQIGQIQIKSKNDLISLVNKIEAIIWNIEDKLDKIIKIYEFSLKKEENKIMLEIQSLNFAFNFKENKIVPKKETKKILKIDFPYQPFE